MRKFIFTLFINPRNRSSQTTKVYLPLHPGMSRHNNLTEACERQKKTSSTIPLQGSTRTSSTCKCNRLGPAGRPPAAKTNNGRIGMAADAQQAESVAMPLKRRARGRHHHRSPLTRRLRLLRASPSRAVLRNRTRSSTQTSFSAAG